MSAGRRNLCVALRRLGLICALLGLSLLTGFSAPNSGEKSSSLSDLAVGTLSDVPTVPSVVASLSATSFTLSNSSTASVQVSCNSACGQVDYRIDGNEWGIVSLDATGSFTAYYFPSITVGTHTLQVSYLGNAAYAPAASNPIGFTVLPPGSTVPSVVASLSATSFTLSNASTASVQVSCNSACGQADYRIDGNEWGTVSLDATGSFTTNQFPPIAVGAHTLQILYLGNDTYAPAASNKIGFTVMSTLLPPVAVTVTPATTTLYAGQKQQLFASVSNTSNTAVTWSASPASSGSINSAGLYTTPATVSQQLSVTVTATSQADTTKSATASIILLPGTSAAYGYERILVVDHTKVGNTDQANFPLLLNTTDPLFATTGNGGHVTSSNGYDIIVSTDPNGLIKLDHELESYNPVTGQVTAWVRVPLLSHTVDTVLYLFYGNTAVTTSQQNATRVWDSNFLEVLHLDEPSGTTVFDSTVNGNHGTKVSTVSPATIAGGEIAGAQSFNGTSDFIALPPAMTGSRTAFSVSFWTDSIDTGSNPTYWNRNQFFGDATPGNNSGDFGVTSNSGLLGMWSGLNTGGDNYIATGNLTSDNKWHRVDTVNDGSIIRLYLDGQDTGQTLASGQALDSYGWYLGAQHFQWGGAAYYHQGNIDEFHVSQSARTADWIMTEFNNQSSPATFYSLSAENSVLVTSTTSALSVPTFSPAAGTYGSPQSITIAYTPSGAAIYYTTDGSTPTASSPRYNGPITISANVSFQAVAMDSTGATSLIGTASYTIVNPPSRTAAPAIATVTPTPAVAGGPITLLGTGFGQLQGANTITLSGVSLAVSEWTDTTITALVPAASNSGTLLATVNGVSSSPFTLAIAAANGPGSPDPNEPGDSGCNQAPCQLNTSAPYFLMGGMGPFFVDPYLLQDGVNSVESVLNNATNAPARGLVVDGVSTVIVVARMGSVEGAVCPGGFLSCYYASYDPDQITFTVDAASGATLLPWTTSFLTNSTTPGTTSITVSSSELVRAHESWADGPTASDGPLYALAILKAPAASTSFSDLQNLAVKVQGRYPQYPTYDYSNTGTIALHHRPVFLIHGLWGDDTSLAHITSYLKTVTDGVSPIWSNPWDVTPLCYSKLLSFDASADTQEGDPRCEKTSSDAIADALKTVSVSLDKHFIVGGQVDVIAHSMGGLATRHFMTLSNYSAPRNHMQGAFNTVLTLDTPEIGSGLANYLIDNASMPYTGNFISLGNVIWTTRCKHYYSQTQTLSLDFNLSQCMADLGLPIETAFGPDDGNCFHDSVPCSAVGSITQNQDADGAISKLPPLPQLSGGWLAFSSSFPSSSSPASVDSVLRYTVQSLIDSINDGVGPTVDSIVGVPNDVIVSTQSQVAGTDGGFRPFFGLAHSSFPDAAGIQAALLITTTDDNVTNNNIVNNTLLCALLFAGDAQATNLCSGAVPAAMMQERELPATFLSQADLLKNASTIIGQTTEYTGQDRSKPFYIQERLVLEHPNRSLILARPNPVGIKIRSESAISRIVSVQTQYYGETGTSRAPIPGSDSVLVVHTREGSDYVDIVPLGLGRVEINVIIYFVDGGVSSENMMVDVVAPTEKPVDLIVGNKADTILLTHGGRSEHPGSKRLFLQAKYNGLTQWIDIPARFATFVVRDASDPPAISVDKNGHIATQRIGHSLIETRYGGAQHLTCVVVSAPNSLYTGRAQCQDLLREGETIGQ